MRRKIMFSMVVIGALLMFTGCTNKKVQALVDEGNKSLPMQVSEGVMATGLTLEGDNIVFNYIVKEDAMDLDALENNKESMKSSLSLMLNNGGSRKLVEISADEGVGLIFEYKVYDSDRVLRIEMSPDEVKEILNTPSTPESRLKALIDNSNLQLPSKIDDGLTLITINNDENNVVYVYETDEDKISLTSLKKNIKNVKAAVVEELKGQNIAEKAFMKTVIENNKGLVYQYVGNVSKKTVDVVINLDELKQIANY